MSNAKRLILLLPLLILCLLVPSADAQTPTWRNDTLGRPAPPCFLLSADGTTTVPCSASNPIPVSGGGAGTGTSSGTSTTGFGRQWYPSTITGTGAAGQQQVALFIDDTQVAFFRRSTGCANCLQVAISTDGGVTGTYFSTSAIIGNSVETVHRVPSAIPVYLVNSIGGPLNSFWSTSLSAGWTAIAGLANPTGTYASNATGSTVLAESSTGAAVQVCRSTDQGRTFASCAAWGAAIPSGLAGNGLAFAGGTTWLFHNNSGEIWRSTDDGLTFTLASTPAVNPGRGIRCLSPGYSQCFYTNSAGNLFRSTDKFTTSTIVQSGTGTGAGLCEFANNANAAAYSGAGIPTGFAAIAQNAFSSSDGISWFVGQTNGSGWDGTGTPTINSIDCRAGRGIATITVAGGSAQQLAVYNPLTSPGGTLQSSAGGYQVAAPIQAGVILNTTPVTSGANAAATVTLTGTAGSRVCIRRIELFSSAAGTPTLTITDGATVVLNFGTRTTGVSALNNEFSGDPLMCGQTNNTVTVNIGAAGVGVTTTTSVVADRYPN